MNTFTGHEPTHSNSFQNEINDMVNEDMRKANYRSDKTIIDPSVSLK